MMRRGLFFYLLPVLVFVASLLQSTTAIRLQIRGVKPDLVLLLVIIGTLMFGSRSSIVWAFLGGVGLDLFSGGPFGASSLALMAAAVVVGIGHNTLSRYNLLVPIGAAMIGTLVYGITYIGLLFALQELTKLTALQPYNLDIIQPDLAFSPWTTLFRPTVQFVVLPALFYNTALLLLTLPWLNRAPTSQDFA